MPGQQALDLDRTPAFTFLPQVVVIELPPSDPLHDRRINTFPVTRDDVLNIISRPPPALDVRRRGNDSIVIDGKQRTKAALVANAIGAGIVYAGGLMSVLNAIAEFSQDEEFCNRVKSLMRGKPIRLRSMAINSGSDADARLLMQARNHLPHVDSFADTVRWVQEEVERFGTPIPDIVLALGGEAKGITERKVNGWLKLDTSTIGKTKPKTQAKSTRPSAKLVDAITVVLSPEARVAARWAVGKATKDDLLRVFPAFRETIELLLKPKAKGKKAAS